jgi:predicted transcriptional regulator
MTSITINLPLDTYKRLEAQARRVGQDPATLSRELLESALQARKAAQSPTTRGVSHAAGPSLSEIILDQRGAKV